MTNKFAMKYKKVFNIHDGDNPDTEKGSLARRRSYLHDHRLEDSLEEYVEKLED